MTDIREEGMEQGQSSQGGKGQAKGKENVGAKSDLGDPSYQDPAGDGGKGGPCCLLPSDGEDVCPKAPPATDDDPAPSADIIRLNFQIADGDAQKPITSERLAYEQGAETVRKDIVKAYSKALGDGLFGDYKKADKQFQSIAKDLTRPVDGKSAPLEAWIANWLDKGKPLAVIFEAQRQLAARLETLGGHRECRLRRADESAKAWKAAHEDWKSPGAKIKVIVDGYKDKLAKLACEIHNGNPYAIYQFWFEIAPRHLGLREQAVSEAIAPGVTLICRALREFPQRRRALASASEREEGGLYLIDPEKLDHHRLTVLDAWRDATTARTTAEVEYTLRPDDAAKLKAALAKQVGEEAANIKKQLELAA
jgi:hypothetical protein